MPDAIVGIDEVGRGPVAGPVSVCAFLLDPEILPLIAETKLPLRDSKKLTKKQREAWFALIGEWQKSGKCRAVVSSVSANLIDKYGIAPATRKALAVALEKLGVSKDTHIVLDGGLKAPEEYTHQITIIKGDESEPAISLASIVAKVTRDKYMEKIAEEYPTYGFDSHVGYGTAAHYSAIKKYGMTPIHRRSFLKNIK